MYKFFKQLLRYDIIALQECQLNLNLNLLGVKFKKTKPDLDIEVVALTGARDDIRGQDVLRGHNEIHITATPAQHWSSRTPFDRNKRLWCSWAIHASVTESNLHDSLVKKRSGVTKIGFFFAGDTGRPKIFPLHRLIGGKLRLLF